MMDDRELLGWAAKAAKQERSVAGDLWSNARGMLWDPLNDDGDALRLAVKLRMSCQFTSYYAVCYAGSPAAKQFTEQATMGYGIEEATRRAIVRAAAEIGKRSDGGV